MQHVPTEGILQDYKPPRSLSLNGLSLVPFNSYRYSSILPQRALHLPPFQTSTSTLLSLHLPLPLHPSNHFCLPISPPLSPPPPTSPPIKSSFSPHLPTLVSTSTHLSTYQIIFFSPISLPFRSSTPPPSLHLSNPPPSSLHAV